VVEALLMAGACDDANGQVFNLGGDEPINLLDLAELLVRIGGKGRHRMEDFPAERKRIDIGDFYGDYRKIMGKLGWRPRVRLEEGLRRTLAYYEQHREYYW
jgi:UDP-glucose 4-epimerase